MKTFSFGKDINKKSPLRTAGRRFRGGVLVGLMVAAPLAHSAVYQPDLANVPEPDVEAQIAAFQVHDGFEVNLFASDPQLVKPIGINFDPQGRLWVVGSDLYPHIQPGEKANDRIFVLEDTDGDGVAEKSTLFAEGLHIPTGLAPGDGGVYVANSTELLFLKDTDGDGKADERRVVLSGFGTEDTHHILHTLRWGYDGNLYMNQSIYIHSHIETPWGPRELLGSGIWQLRPENLHLDILMRGLVNPWGHHFDRYGQSFATDGAGGEGINYVVPGASYVTAVGAERILPGLNPGSPKHCGLEFATGSHLPEDWRGSLLTCDFRARRVCRFELSEDGSGFASREQPEILTTDFVSFRPVDIKMGPDGAIYIADWYNPIIQHGEVDFRDPRRDHQHGRIWRISAKGRPTVERPQLVGAPTVKLLDQLLAEEGWTREQARRVLKERGREEVLAVLANWLADLDPPSGRSEEARLEALWLYEALDVPNRDLLVSVLGSPDPRVRAAGVRVISQWKKRLPDPLSLLEKSVLDDHPRVRLESIRALAVLPELRSAQLAVQVLDRPMDKFLDYGLWLTLRDLKDQWLPGVQAGEPVFGEAVSHLTFALQAINSPSALQPLIGLIEEKRIPKEKEGEVLALIAEMGGPSEMSMILDLVLSSPEEEAGHKVVLLDALVSTAKQRKIAPDRGADRIVPLFEAESEALSQTAVEAAGLWKIEEARARLEALASSSRVSLPLRSAAFQAIAHLGGDSAKTFLAGAAQDRSASPEEAGEAIPGRISAVVAMVMLDATRGAELAAEVLADFPPGQDPTVLFQTVIGRKEGPEHLARALAGKSIPADAAKIGVRLVGASGQTLPGLMNALVLAGGLSQSRTSLEAGEMEALLKAAHEEGNASRGEEIFRRAALQCLLCHAIAGSGGQVGPDLTTIGASAQPDYLVDSLINPSKAIKEGFHSIVVNTAEGEVLSGIRVRETKEALVIRDQGDHEIEIPKAEVVSVTDGLSLMPNGLTDFLTREELRDLVRFLSELGKAGDYAVSTQQIVRTWRTLTVTPGGSEKLRIDGERALLEDSPEIVWTPLYSKATGALPMSEVPEVVKQWKDDPHSFLRFQVEATSPGKATLALNSSAGLKGWVDGKPSVLGDTWVVDLEPGLHTLTLSINRAQRSEDLLLALIATPGSQAHVRMVGGK